jgi:CubicO group peptidase (beta-lactamase class C family)
VAPRPPAPRTEHFAKDTRIKSNSGVSVIVPARWHLTRKATHMELEEPDKGLWMALVELEGETPQAAIAEAWKKVRPDFALDIKKKSAPPPSVGWDEVLQITYETPTRQRRVVLAVARGKGKKYYVALIDGKIAAFSRRGAQMMTVISSLEVPGVKEESFAGKKAQVFDAARQKKLETFIRDARQKLNVVGGAVALVQNGKTVYAKGFGVRRKGKRRKVTPRTLFMIGSMTKPLTSMLMAKMVDAGKFKWDTPVQKVYPGFGLADETLAQKCQMKHTVCACTGMPRQDMEFLFEYENATAKSRFDLLKTMKPTTAFGETFQYSNLMVSAGGFVSGHAAYPKMKIGRAFLRAINRHLFKPAGMRATTFSFKRARRADHASPHGQSFQMTYAPMPYKVEKAVSSVGPAGGAWSSVRDIARYMLLELGKGKLGKKQLISEANLTERWKPQARISEKKHYGLALITQNAHDVRILGHGGATLGFSSNMAFLPDHGVGMVVLTNCAGAGAFTSLVFRRFLELLFDGKEIAAQRLAFVLKKRKEALARFLKKAKLEPAAKWLKKHVGVYAHPALGRLEVKIVKRKAKAKGKTGVKGVVDVGEWQAPIAKVTEKDGTVKLVIGPPLTGVAFLPGTHDGKKTLTLHAGQHSHRFVAK